jgi:hypothetical protein
MLDCGCAKKETISVKMQIVLQMRMLLQLTKDRGVIGTATAIEETAAVAREIGETVIHTAQQVNNAARNVSYHNFPNRTPTIIDGKRLAVSRKI